MIETLILRDMERERLSNFLSVKTVSQAVVAPGNTEAIGDLMEVLLHSLLPWERSTSPARQTESSEVERLVQTYKKLEELKLIKRASQ